MKTKTMRNRDSLEVYLKKIKSRDWKRMFAIHLYEGINK